MMSIVDKCVLAVYKSVYNFLTVSFQMNQVTVNTSDNSIDETSIEDPQALGTIQHEIKWKEDSRFHDPIDNRFVARIVSIFITSKGLRRSFDFRIAKPALELAVNDVSDP